MNGMAVSDLSPAISVFISLLVAIGGLYLLRIPQAARVMAHSWARLQRASDARIEALVQEIEEVRRAHEECEKKAEQMERRIRALERR